MFDQSDQRRQSALESNYASSQPLLLAAAPDEAAVTFDPPVSLDLVIDALAADISAVNVPLGPLAGNRFVYVNSPVPPVSSRGDLVESVATRIAATLPRLELSSIEGVTDAEIAEVNATIQNRALDVVSAETTFEALHGSPELASSVYDIAPLGTVVLPLDAESLATRITECSAEG